MWSPNGKVWSPKINNVESKVSQSRSVVMTIGASPTFRSKEDVYIEMCMHALHLKYSLRRPTSHLENLEWRYLCNGFSESADRMALWGCKVSTHQALPGPSAAAACTACRSL